MIAATFGAVLGWRRWALRFSTAAFTLALFGWQLDFAVAPSDEPWSDRRRAYYIATAVSGLATIDLRYLLDRDERRAQQRAEAVAAARHQDLLEALTPRPAPHRRWGRHLLLAVLAVLYLRGGTSR